MFNTIIGAGAAMRYDSGEMMRLLAASAPQHCLKPEGDKNAGKSQVGKQSTFHGK
jgi:hypothetical protein